MAYTRSFYEKRHNDTLHSARSVLGIVKELYNFESCVDFGCGIGTWLSVSRELGANSVDGYDGPWVPKDFLQIKQSEFHEFNLESGVRLEKKYDLAISLEVAEHLTEIASNKLIEIMTQAASLIVFSAAIPFQGGNGHINEQWVSNWIDKFQKRGYQLLDVVRPQIWNDEKIPFWYKQNIIVVFDPSNISVDINRFDKNFHGLNLVHPDMYQIRANPSVVERLKLFYKTPSYVLKRLIGKRY